MKVFTLLASIGCLLAITISARGAGCPTASFEPARKTDLGAKLGTKNGRAADFNGDGKLDLVVEYDGAFATLLLGKGDGYFEAPQRLAPSAFVTSIIHVVADFNGDGISDLILRDPNPSLWLAREDGGFDRRLVAIGDEGFGKDFIRSVVAADFNGDGRADLAGGSLFYLQTNVLVSLNTGDAYFRTAVEYEIGLPVGYVYIKPGDVDGDGDLDLIRISDASSGRVVPGPSVIWSYTNTVSVLLNDGNGTFQIGPSRYAGAWIMSRAAVADFNGDGKADLACSHHYEHDSFIPQTSVVVLLGNGDGTFGPPVVWGAAWRVASIFAADFNGDGAMDLGSTGGVGMMLGNGDGTFGAPVALPLTVQQNWTVVGDFNGDGQTDVATDETSRVQVFLNACAPPRPPPNGLAIQRSGPTAVLSWPLVPAGSLLESTTNAALTGWSGVLGSLTTNEKRWELQTPIEGAQRYFRLREAGL